MTVRGPAATSPHPEEAGMRRRISYGQYLAAVAATLARRHRPVWSWIRWRYVCKCGDELPCRQRHKVPIGRRHWPGERE